MGSISFKSQEKKLINKQREIIYQKWKYDIIKCYITFDNNNIQQTNESNKNLSQNQSDLNLIRKSYISIL